MKSRQNKSWRCSTHMQLKLWDAEENRIFFSHFARTLSITRSTGLRLTRGILDMGSLGTILKGLETSDYDWLLMDELEADYPQGCWWEMVWALAELQNKLPNHSIHEINYKTIRAVESLVIPLNAMFQGGQVGQQFLLNQPYHPLTMAVFRHNGESFIDHFVQMMIEHHGERMIAFLQVCKENLVRLSSPSVDDLVVKMNRLSLEA
ncbi:hypothetical protein GGI25_005173 [Coemansia spiralis]|uniref:Uncharacterized protein n=2 Tax=Coemansia TaxID=4863 RepID=A0A9W8KWQ6_9FUNG|nr:hypothetical protein BX070DRAFT_224670 [Coemansia spiralis]KAJ1989341.1 hypothetical protein EDC05_004735 [Coemansia umbellata]KAJ2620386.1 hypothetical protein GGI26_005028 [Coemansia sp. RSA 1358]KAJ2672291.1 hypothetical protein GGI25_005173 [Coemansia spiralis]